MPERWTNRATGLLSAGIGAGDLALALGTGEGAAFPTLVAGDYFWGVLEEGPRAAPTLQEYVQATARAGDSVTIVRAQQGSSPQGFGADARFEHRITRRTLEDLRDRLLPANRLLGPIGFLGTRNTTNDPFGAGFNATSGSVSTPTLATGTQTGGTGRLRRSGSGSVGWRSTGTSRFWRGNGADRGGFRLQMRGQLGANNATTRMFIGFVDLDSFLVVGNPSAATTRQILGFGFDDTVGTGGVYSCFVHDGGGGAVTVTSTGIVRSTSNLLEIIISAEPNASAVHLEITDLSSGTTFTNDPTANLPASTTFLYGQMSVQGNGGANTGQLDIAEADVRSTW